jgi:hypothetical protein
VSPARITDSNIAQIGARSLARTGRISRFELDALLSTFNSLIVLLVLSTFYFCLLSTFCFSTHS